MSRMLRLALRFASYTLLVSAGYNGYLAVAADGGLLSAVYIIACKLDAVLAIALAAAASVSGERECNNKEDEG